MDKQKQIEKMAKNKEFKKLVRLIENTHPFYVETIAERILEKYQPKIPEGVVVLTRAHEDKIFNDYVEYIKKVRKETAEKFAERVKEETDHGISALYDSTVDKICKEITEGDNG